MRPHHVDEDQADQLIDTRLISLQLVAVQYTQYASARTRCRVKSGVVAMRW